MERAHYVSLRFNVFVTFFVPVPGLCAPKYWNVSLVLALRATNIPGAPNIGCIRARTIRNSVTVR